MSRVGKEPVKIPSGTEVKVDKNNVVTIKGPKGEVTGQINPEIKLEVKDGQITLTRPTEQKRHKSLHGLSRALLANMIKGITDGFTIQLELYGVGYRASASGNKLELAVGFSHPIVFVLPPEVKAEAEMKKGQPPLITLTSHDKQLVGQVAAKIRSVRKPEPYKGKGIRYKDEYVRRKAGKAVASA